MENGSGIEARRKVSMAAKGMLLYCLGTVVLIGIHERYGNDIMRVVRAHNHSGFKNCSLLSLRLLAFYWTALTLPSSHAANTLLSLLLLYILLSQ